MNLFNEADDDWYVYFLHICGDEPPYNAWRKRRQEFSPYMWR